MVAKKWGLILIMTGCFEGHTFITDWLFCVDLYIYKTLIQVFCSQSIVDHDIQPTSWDNTSAVLDKEDAQGMVSSFRLKLSGCPIKVVIID